MIYYFFSEVDLGVILIHGTAVVTIEIFEMKTFCFCFVSLLFFSLAFDRLTTLARVLSVHTYPKLLIINKIIHKPNVRSLTHRSEIWPVNYSVGEIIN